MFSKFCGRFYGLPGVDFKLYKYLFDLVRFVETNSLRILSSPLCARYFNVQTAFLESCACIAFVQQNLRTLFFLIFSIHSFPHFATCLLKIDGYLLI